MAGYCNWKKEFPNVLNDIEPQFLAGLIDQSWHNDALPMFTLNISDTDCLLITIDHEKQEDREMVNPDRFSLSRVKREGEGFDLDGTEELLYQGSDLERLKQEIKRHSP